MRKLVDRAESKLPSTLGKFSRPLENVEEGWDRCRGGAIDIDVEIKWIRKQRVLSEGQLDQAWRDNRNCKFPDEIPNFVGKTRKHVHLC